MNVKQTANSGLDYSEMINLLEVAKFNIMMNSGIIILDGKPLHEME
jgi:hypothetical protein